MVIGLKEDHKCNSVVIIVLIEMGVNWFSTTDWLQGEAIFISDIIDIKNKSF